VTLLGPQRSPSLRSVVRSLEETGPIATVTAGWQEREPDDAELDQQVDSRGINLSLYGRWLDVQEHDPDFAAAEQDRRHVLDEVQELYLIRLDHALRAAYAIGRRGDPRRADGGRHHLVEEAFTGAVEAVRDLDAAHLRRIDEVNTEFFDRWRPHDRPLIARHRAEVAAVLQEAAVLVVAGGHVDALATVLHLFNVAAALHAPVIAWSAGAMALADRVVLFHDRSPQGFGQPEVYGNGLSVVRALVPLPHARARLLLDDVTRMAVFARRFAPARCVLLENGTRVDTDSDGTCPPGARVLGDDGRVTTQVAA